MSIDRRTGEPISDEEMDRRARSPARVKFSDVGAGRATWEADVKSISNGTLLREVKRRHALASRFVDFEVDDDDWPPRGDIVVGGMRAVGRWEVIERVE